MTPQVGYQGCGLANAGSKCTVTCSPGYWGTPTAYTCTPIGQWTPDGAVGTCSPVTYVQILDQVAGVLATALLKPFYAPFYDGPH
jgi:hypothetical protein